MVNVYDNGEIIARVKYNNALKQILKEQKDEIDLTLQALENFRKAYFQLLYKWWDNDILDNTESLNKYPFNKSFDALSIPQWIEETIEEIKANIER